MIKKAHITRLENLIYDGNSLTEYDQVCVVCGKIDHVSLVPEIDYCPGKPEDMV